MSQEFEQLDLQEIQQETQRTSKDESFLDQFVRTSEGAGAVPLRILPPLKGRKLYQYNRIHSINGRKVHCPRPLVNGKWDRSVRCPLCEYYSSLWKQADRLEREGHKQEAETLKDEARLLKPIERYYYNAIVRREPGKDGVLENVGPKILSVGVTVHRKVMAGITGDENGPGLGNVTDVKNGHDFILRKELRGEFPDYGSSAFVSQPSPMGTAEQITRWKNNLIDLSTASQSEVA